MTSSGNVQHIDERKWAPNIDDTSIVTITLVGRSILCHDRFCSFCNSSALSMNSYSNILHLHTQTCEILQALLNMYRLLNVNKRLERVLKIPTARQLMVQRILCQVGTLTSISNELIQINPKPYGENFCTRNNR